MFNRLYKLSPLIKYKPIYKLNPLYFSTKPSLPYSQQATQLPKSELYFLSFNCNICNKKSQKFISKKSYHEGIVIVICDGCQHKHLIADRLGWFKDNTDSSSSGIDIEKLMNEKGEKVHKELNDQVLEILTDKKDTLK